jgi:hypothetical protein
MSEENRIATKFVALVTVIDPDTGYPVEVEIRKMANGPMVGLDGAFLASSDEDAVNPYDGESVLIIPDDEN